MRCGLPPKITLVSAAVTSDTQIHVPIRSRSAVLQCLSVQSDGVQSAALQCKAATLHSVLSREHHY